MLPIQTFLKTQNKLSYILNKAFNVGLSAPTPNISNQTLHRLRKIGFNKYMGRKLEYMSVYIDFNDLVPNLSNSNKLHKEFSKIMTHFCVDKDKDIYEQSFGDRLSDLCEERKIIFINMGIDKYFVDRSEKTNYAVHGVCAILVPRYGSGYDMYYINSHGNDMNDTSFYQTVKTRTRLNRIDFKQPVDCLVMKALTNYLNKEYELEITYDSSIKHNYFGPNLQNGDEHGICFAFPIVIYCYFGLHFTEKKALTMNDKTIYIVPFKQLLKNGQIDLMVSSCFSDFDKTINKILFELNGEKINLDLLSDCIEKSRFRFVKKVTNTIVSFMSQGYLMKRV